MFSSKNKKLFYSSWECSIDFDYKRIYKRECESESNPKFDISIKINTEKKYVMKMPIKATLGSLAKSGAYMSCYNEFSSIWDAVLFTDTVLKEDESYEAKDLLVFFWY